MKEMAREAMENDYFVPILAYLAGFFLFFWQNLAISEEKQTCRDIRSSTISNSTVKAVSGMKKKQKHFNRTRIDPCHLARKSN